MRFGAPRSASPSPVRSVSRVFDRLKRVYVNINIIIRHRKRSPPMKRTTYGVPSDSSEEEFSDSESFESTSSTDSYGSEPESEASTSFPLSSKPTAASPRGLNFDSNTRRVPQQAQKVSEQYNIEDMLASIRLRVAHHDAYEEWEQQTRKDAFVSIVAIIASPHVTELRISYLLDMSKPHSERIDSIELQYHKCRRQTTRQLCINDNCKLYSRGLQSGRRYSRRQSSS